MKNRIYGFLVTLIGLITAIVSIIGPGTVLELLTIASPTAGKVVVGAKPVVAKAQQTLAQICYTDGLDQSYINCTDALKPSAQLLQDQTQALCRQQSSEIVVVGTDIACDYSIDGLIADIRSMHGAMLMNPAALQPILSDEEQTVITKAVLILTDRLHKLSNLPVSEEYAVNGVPPGTVGTETVLDAPGIISISKLNSDVQAIGATYFQDEGVLYLVYDSKWSTLNDPNMSAMLTGIAKDMGDYHLDRTDLTDKLLVTVIIKGNEAGDLDVLVDDFITTTGDVAFDYSEAMEGMPPNDRLNIDGMTYDTVIYRTTFVLEK